MGGMGMRIIAVDDHTLFLEALVLMLQKSFPDSEVVTFEDLASAHDALHGAGGWDLLLLDLYLSGGMAPTEAIRDAAALKQGAIAMISGSASAADVAECIDAGARGFLTKTMTRASLTAAIQLILAGGTYVPAEFLSRPLTEADKASADIGMWSGPLRDLTDRERAVLERLAVGQSNKEIARDLELEEVTVKFHARNIYRKLGVRNRVEASNLFNRIQSA